MIKTINLCKRYQTDEVETTALNDINLEIAAAEFVAIMGPSGCGKSTLLNILGLLDVPNSGSYILLDKEMAELNEKQRARYRKSNIGFIFQSFNLIDELTVYENVELPLVYQGIKPQERKKLVEQALDKMNILHRRNHYPQQLSGGQQQRTAVARAVITKPKLVFADEPTGNLDSAHGDEVMKILTELNEAGTTIIMVTHSQHDASFSHRTIHLLDGKVVAEDIKKMVYA